MKQILKCFMFFIIINILSGCSFKGLSEMMLEEENQDLPSSIGTISSDFLFAVLGTGEIAFLTIDSKEVVFLDEKQKNRRSVELSENRQSLEITAGNDYFYVYCSNEDETAGFLNVFDKKGELIKEISLPFSRVSVSNGIVYGYYDETADFNGWDSNISNSHIEATHYISERKFLEKFPNCMDDWNEISGDEIANVGEQQFYRCSSDYCHNTDYYSDQKPLSVFGQIDYVRYCDGKIASEESDKEIRSRLNQIYSMMKKKEENFLIYSFQTNDKIYGICNVYSQYGELLTFCTDDLDYSFSFSYDEKEDKLYKVNEYTNIELIYEDEYNCLYHKLDGVYYTKLGSDKEEKLYDYNGEIGLTILEGYVKFQEREIHYNDDIIDKQKIIKVW
ncbi:hypothetical protein DXB73_04455 [Clostridium sp. OM05-6BH]|uniref:hypothetical protein n=1 Tax=unclassified Clostridium TaxID=2614128 RepID=UPI000E4AF4DE|nr:MULTISPECIES: hypothetical protein [unclassified Clostridium]RHV15931.1 hypothetical protein DXB78_05480 [Clostridium sp. OM05-9BH]RHV20120.1 hypothetical protein DXB73_04455 [Clostridium sp. OM05-6BH]